jgi:uncharacterized protein YkwD
MNNKITLAFGIAALVMGLGGCGGGGGGGAGTPTAPTDPGGQCTEDIPWADSNLTEDYLASLNDVTDSERAGLDYLNYYRRLVGLPEFRWSDELHVATKAHANYLDANPSEESHDEISGHDLYYASSIWDRDHRAGYATALTSENFGPGIAEADGAPVKGLMTAIYHRFNILNFNFDEVGVGENTNLVVHVEDFGNGAIRELCEAAEASGTTPSDPVYVCSNNCVAVEYSDVMARMDVTAGDLDAILYPAPGQSDVQTVFFGETPDPIPGHSFSGLPASVQFNPYTQDCGAIADGFQSMTLYDLNESRNIDPLKVMTGANDPNNHFTQCDYAFFPKESLTFGHTYRVDFNTTEPGASKSWTFTVKKPEGTVVTVTGSDLNLTVGNGDYYLYIPPTDETFPTAFSYSYSLGEVSATIDNYDPDTLHVQITGGQPGDTLNLTINPADGSEVTVRLKHE